MSTRIQYSPPVRGEFNLPIDHTPRTVERAIEAYLRSHGVCLHERAVIATLVTHDSGSWSLEDCI